MSAPGASSALLLAVTVWEALGDLGLGILLAAAGSIALTVSIGLAMRGGAGFVDLDREGRFSAAILSLTAAGFFALVALVIVATFVLLLIRG